jgi:hypothetical protein
MWKLDGKATDPQRKIPIGETLMAEHKIAIASLKNAGFSPFRAQSIADEALKYFTEELKLDYNVKTIYPGTRRRK